MYHPVLSKSNYNQKLKNKKYVKKPITSYFHYEWRHVDATSRNHKSEFSKSSE